MDEFPKKWPLFCKTVDNTDNTANPRTDRLLNLSETLRCVSRTRQERIHCVPWKRRKDPGHVRCNLNKHCPTVNNFPKRSSAIESLLIFPSHLTRTDNHRNRISNVVYRQEAKLSPRDPRDALYQLKYWPTDYCCTNNANRTPRVSHRPLPATATFYSSTCIVLYTDHWLH